MEPAFQVGENAIVPHMRFGSSGFNKKGPLGSRFREGWVGPRGLGFMIEGLQSRICNSALGFQVGEHRLERPEGPQAH